jgi:hypothetical protein
MLYVKIWNGSRTDKKWWNGEYLNGDMVLFDSLNDFNEIPDDIKEYVNKLLKTSYRFLIIGIDRFGNTWVEKDLKPILIKLKESETIDSGFLNEFELYNNNISVK